MKIREGFVSNSSSSSFVVIGRRVKARDADFDNHTYTFVGWNDWCVEGEDVFELTPAHISVWPYVSDAPEWLWEDAHLIYEEGKIELPAGEYDVESGSADYYSSSEVGDFLERYELDESLVIEALLEGLNVPSIVLEKMNPKTVRVIKMYQEGHITLEGFKGLMDE